MNRFLTELFTWWNGPTMGTRFYTWRKGVFVGEDEAGNRYYRERNRDRRWVIYNGYDEASAIPAAWHAWMHHRSDTPPTEQDYKARDWQQPHRANPTGTAKAYRPGGSILRPHPHTPGGADYEPWSP